MRTKRVIYFLVNGFYSKIKGKKKHKIKFVKWTRKKAHSHTHTK